MAAVPLTIGGAVMAANTIDFAALYRATLPDVYGYLARRVGSSALAEDLTQEVFLAAADAIRRGRAETVTASWLMTVARNKMVDHFRRQGRATGLAAVRPDEDDLADWQLEPSRDHVIDALEQVPGDHRAVLVLRYVDGLAVPEVAQAIGRSVHATESLLVRARASFKRACEEVAHV